MAKNKGLSQVQIQTAVMNPAVRNLGSLGAAMVAAAKKS